MLAELATRLVATPTDPVLLAAASAHIQAGAGAALFDALLEATGGQSRATMATLEAMFDARPAVAGYLMARLLMVAGKQKEHSVFDAIGLWIGDCGDAELAVTLTRLADEGVRPKLADRVRSWASAVAARAQENG